MLSDEQLEQSEVVANSTMNRQRRARGVNSYERELGLDPLLFLSQCLEKKGSARWLDLACGRGLALIEAATHFTETGSRQSVQFRGVDLVDAFDPIPGELKCLEFELQSLHHWTTDLKWDLITCVHGLHYVGDKLALIQKMPQWLAEEGLLLAHLDLANLRSAKGLQLRGAASWLTQQGFTYLQHRHLLKRIGPAAPKLVHTYLGADVRGGPNYTGQPAVNSWYMRDYD